MQLLQSGDAIAGWLREHVRSDIYLSAPYRRRWSLGGCEPSQFLATWPTDRLTKLGSDLYSFGLEARASDVGVHLSVGAEGVTIAVGRTDLGDGPPTEYAIFVGTDSSPAYVTNSPEVVTQLIREFGEPLQPIPESDLIQVGFPGRPSGELTYIGSWQWDIHSEAHSPDFVVRAARAIVDAIEAREKDL